MIELPRALREIQETRLCRWESITALFSGGGGAAAGGTAAGGTAAAGGGAATSAGITAADVATYAGYAATALSTIGGIAQSQQQAAAFKEQAEAQQQQDELAAQATERENRSRMARNRATAVGSGVDPFSGSPNEVEMSNAFQAGLNEALIRYGGGVRSRQSRLSAAGYRGQIPGIVGKGLADTSSIMGRWYYSTKGRNP